MKKTFFPILIFLLLAFPIFASPGLNTHSMDFESSSSQYAYATDSTELSITGDMTIEAWIKLEQLPSTPAFQVFQIAGKWASGDTDYIFYVSHVDDKLWCQYSSDGGSTRTKGNVDTAFDAGDVGAWIHVAVAIDVSAADMTFYIDGSSVARTMTATDATAIHAGNAPFVIGAGEDGAANYFDGKIDDVRVWNDIRASTEISNNYQTQLNGNDAGLVAYWMLNNNAEDKGEITDPAGSTADDLTLVNSPVYSTDVPFEGEAADTCTCPSTPGHWTVNSGDNCYLTTECNIAGYTLYLIDTGGTGFHILDAGKLVVGAIQTTTSDFTLEAGGELYFR